MRTKIASSWLAVLACVYYFCVRDHVTQCQLVAFSEYTLAGGYHAETLAHFFANTPNGPPPLSFRGLPIGLFRTFAPYPPFIGTHTVPGAFRGSYSTPSVSQNNDQGMSGVRRLLYSEDSSGRSTGQSNQSTQLVSSTLLESHPATEQLASYGTTLQPERSATRVNSLTPVLEADGSSATSIIIDGLHYTRPTNASQDSVDDVTQLILLRYDDWLNMINVLSVLRETVCALHRVKNDNRYGFSLLNNFTEKPPPPSEYFRWFIEPSSLSTVVEIPRTGIYTLFLLSCIPETTSRILHGRLYLRNYFGYLSGVEAPKLSSYALTLFVYLFLLAVWVVTLTRKRQQVTSVHVVLSVFLAVCSASSGAFYAFYRQWNDLQSFSSSLLILSLITASLRTALAIVCMVIACLGYGLTTTELQFSERRKLTLFLISYVVLDSIRRIVTNPELAVYPPFGLVLLCSVPVFLLHITSFFWCLRSISALKKDLLACDQHQTYSRAVRLYIFLFCFVGATVALKVSWVLFNSFETVEKARYVWLFTPFFPEMLCVLFLSFLMQLWRPSNDWQAIMYRT